MKYLYYDNNRHSISYNIDIFYSTFLSNGELEKFILSKCTTVTYLPMMKNNKNI